MEVSPYVLLTIVGASVAWLALVLWQSYSKSSRFSKLLNNTPGPSSSLIFGNALGFLVRPQNQFLEYFEQLNNSYRPIFHLWFGPFMGTIHISSWKYAEKIFNSNVLIDKSSTYKYLHSWLGTGLLTSTGAKWHSRRKLLTPAFHRSVLDDFQEVFVEKGGILVEKLKPKSNGQTFDIAPYIWQCSLDIICETAMGTKMKIQEKLSETDAAYLDAIGSVSELTLRRFLRPWLHPKLIFDLTPSGRKFNRYVKIMHSFTNKIIKSRKAEYLKLQRSNANEIENDDFGIKSKKRKAFIDILIEAAYSEGHEKKPILSDEDIREEVDTFMFEGHDTTASGISWTLYLLGRHPEIQEKVAQELNDVLGNERADTSQKLSELRLLDRCIRESLRLYPSVPIIGRKFNEDVSLGEFVVPADTEAAIHMYFIHRDPDIFPEPNKFNPDNFLPEVCEKRPPFAFVPFSAGSRNCIGQKFAMQEAKTVVATILQNYRLESVDSPDDLILLSELILRSENGINLRIYPRKLSE